MNVLNALHFLNPWRRHSPVQILLLTDLHARHGFKTTENECFFDFAAFNLSVAVSAVLQNQFIGRDYIPKALIIHWGQPLFDLIQIFEFFHAPKIPKLDAPMQKLQAKRGWI